jgi:hypothetical protein
MPLVMQYNKRDLPGAMSIKVLQMALNAREAPALETVAIHGEGVADAFQAALEAVSTRVEAEISGGSDRDLVRGAISPPLPDAEEVRQTLHAIATLRPDEAHPEPPEHPEPTEEHAPGLEDDADSDTQIPEILEPVGAVQPEPEPEPAPAPPAEAEPAVSTPPLDPSPEVTQPVSGQARIPADDPAVPAYAIVTLPYLPAQLEDYDVHSVAEPIIEPDGTVMVRIAMVDPANGRLRRVRVRLVTELTPRTERAIEPISEPQGSHAIPTLLTLVIGFGLGVGVVWLFLS